MKPSIVGDVRRIGAWIRPWLFDGAVAAFVAALTLFEYRLPWSVKICGLAMALVLIWRRHLPLTVLAAVYLLAPLHLLMNSYVRMFDVAVLIAMYSVVLYRPQLRWGVVAGAGAGVAVLVAAFVEHHRSGNFWVVFWVVGAVTVATWVTAYGVRTRRLYVQTLEERAATLERERDHLALLAVAEERAAIAREIHDVVAHSLSVMIVQADAAGYTLEGPDTPAREALAAIAETGREALDDMGRVIQLLRGTPSRAPGDTEGPGDRSGAEPGRSWGIGRDSGDVGAAGGAVAEDDLLDGDETGRRAIGLKEIDGLVARSRLRVVRETVGTPDRLTAAQEVTAYRIIQESLTNTLRHAGTDAAVTVRLAFTPQSVRVEVSDDGGGVRRVANAVPARPGHGLAGMRERVTIHGGDLVAGPRAEGGWRVVATIPRTSRSTMTPTSTAPSSTAPSSTAPMDTASPSTASTKTA
ncbi:two-component sensor histidine kinase [Amorphoplanes auranticolor]|uniref:histidine kinase n=1 Tax=Actinoplanes auranticolor TaxID=47988 RepID=A0A919SD38_9ACTN|nr:two-component sensor histidine kinase [Actinoplanes auranticolor]